MDSSAQIDGVSSKPFWIVRFKNVIYKQKKFPRKLSHLKMFRNRLLTIFWDVDNIYRVDPPQICSGDPTEGGIFEATLDFSKYLGRI